MLSPTFFLFFVEIYRNGSVSAAAEKLNYSQSGLSHALNRAEKELGFKLFTRDKDGLHLTTESKLLLPLAQKIVADFNDIEETIHSIQKVSRGIIKIGTYSSLSMHFLPKIINQFNKDFPEIVIKIREGSREEIKYALLRKEIDIGFTSLAPDDPFEQIALFYDPIVAVFPKVFPVETDQHGAFDVQKLNQYKIIMPIMDNTIDFDVERVFTQNSLNSDIQASSMDYISILCMIRNGIGVSLLPKFMVLDFLHDLLVLPIAPAAYRTLGMEINSKKSLPPHVITFMRYVKKYLTSQFLIDYESQDFLPILSAKDGTM